MLRRKLASVLEQARVAPDSHDGKDLTEILEGYPREELFQISVEELAPIALAVLRLRTHRQTRLFLRKDIYGRFMSCIVYLPRDRVHHRGAAADTGNPARGPGRGRRRVQRHGRGVGDGPAARGGAGAAGHVAAGRGRRRAGGGRLAAAARSWDEDLAAEATRPLGEQPARAMLGICSGAIPETYKADVLARRSAAAT